MRAFAKKGYHGTQVADVIAEAEVARGTFYLYFDSKHAIFNEILQAISAKIMEQIRPIDMSDLLGIPGQIKGNLERTATALLADPGLVKILFSDAVGVDKEFDSHLHDFYAGILAQIKRALDHGQNLGLVRGGDTATLAVFLLGSVKEIFYQNVLGNQDLGASDLVNEVYTFVTHAVLKPGMA